MVKIPYRILKNNGGNFTKVPRVLVEKVKAA